jgi:hypothetical protein
MTEEANWLGSKIHKLSELPEEGERRSKNSQTLRNRRRMFLQKIHKTLAMTDRETPDSGSLRLSGPARSCADAALARRAQVPYHVP